MKKIMMAKYGFERWPDQDYSDDGQTFICYKVGERVEVSKTTYKGEAFIDGNIHGTKLPYDIYSKLPHYATVSKLNGVSIESLTDQDLIDLYEACLAYEQEYTEAENTIKMPTYQEIQEQCVKVQAKRIAEMAEVETLLAKKVTKLMLNTNEWQWKDIRHYYVQLSKEAQKYNTFVDQIFNKSHSIGFCQPDCNELKDSWYYTHLLEMLAAV